MMRLLGAEFVRLFSRRLFRTLAIAVGVLIVIITGFTFFRSSKDANSGLAAAQQEVQRCEQSRAQALAANQPDAKNWECPTVDQLRPQFDRRFRFGEMMPDGVRATTILLLVLSILIGASFVGAEWGTGAMTTLLTWEPRRWRVFAAKAAACLLGVTAFAVGVLALVTLIHYPVGALRGTTSGVNGRWWRDIVFQWLRGGGLAAFAAALGMGFSTISRNTAGGAGVGLAYGAIVDQILGQLFRGRFRPWLVTRQLQVILGFPVSPAPSEMRFQPNGNLGISEIHFTMWRPALLLTIYGLGLLAAAYASFARRDVT